MFIHPLDARQVTTQRGATYTPPPKAQSMEDLQQHISRIETRLVKLMHHMGIDTHGNPL